MDKKKFTAIILSAGTGSRMKSNMPKQYMELLGKPVIYYSIKAFEDSPVDEIVIVCSTDYIEYFRHSIIEKYGFEKVKAVVQGGKERYNSVYEGLKAANGTDYVLIHDAARPFMSEDLLNRTLSAAVGHDGAIPVLPVTDTMYRSRDGKTLNGCLPRGEIYAGQAPEAFRFGPYLEANEALLPDRIRGINGSTEPALMAGLDMAILPGEPGNFKVTIAEDMDRVRQIIMGDDVSGG